MWPEDTDLAPRGQHVGTQSRASPRLLGRAPGASGLPRGSRGTSPDTMLWAGWPIWDTALSRRDAASREGGTVPAVPGPRVPQDVGLSVLNQDRPRHTSVIGHPSSWGHWPRLEIFLVFTSRGHEGGQGCCPVPYGAQKSPHNRGSQPQMPAVPRLRNSGPKCSRTEVRPFSQTATGNQ